MPVRARPVRDAVRVGVRARRSSARDLRSGGTHGRAGAVACASTQVRRRSTRPFGLWADELRQPRQQPRGQSQPVEQRRRKLTRCTRRRGARPPDAGRVRSASRSAAPSSRGALAQRSSLSRTAAIASRERLRAEPAARQRAAARGRAARRAAPSGTGRARAARGSAARPRARPSSWCRRRRGARPPRRAGTAPRARASPPRITSSGSGASPRPAQPAESTARTPARATRVEHEPRARGGIGVGHAAEADVDGRLARAQEAPRASRAAAPRSKGCRQPIDLHARAQVRRRSAPAAPRRRAAGTSPRSSAYRSPAGAQAEPRALAVDHAAQGREEPAASPTRRAGSARAAARRAARRRASGAASAAATGSRRRSGSARRPSRRPSAAESCTPAARIQSAPRAADASSRNWRTRFERR